MKFRFIVSVAELLKKVHSGCYDLTRISDFDNQKDLKSQNYYREKCSLLSLLAKGFARSFHFLPRSKPDIVKILSENSFINFKFRQITLNR